MVQKIEGGVILKESWHICLVDVNFSSIIGFHATKTELMLELKSAPVMRRKDLSSHPMADKHLLDPTGGQIAVCPYQKVRELH